MVFKFRGDWSPRCVAFVCIALFAQLALAGDTQMVQLFPVGDSTLIDRAIDDPAADGAGQALYIGRTGANDGFTLRRALIAFDIAALIPPGSTIESVELVLDVNRVPPDPGGFQTMAHRMTSPWTEGPTEAFTGTGAIAPLGSGDQTWHFSAYDTVLWVTPGGDFVAEASGSVLMIDTGSYSLVSGGGPETLEADVQSWLDSPETNFGWMLQGVEDPGNRTGKRLSSRESGSTPLLNVTFTPVSGPPPPEPSDIPTASTWGLLALIGVLSIGGWFTLQRR